MANKSPIQRICAVCRKKQDTNNMTRVVRLNGDFVIQKDKRLNGRGAHICSACVIKAVQTKALNKSFRSKLPDKIYDELLANKIDT